MVLSGEQRVGDQASWPLDPTELAVESSRWRRGDELPEAFCVELGRRLLLAQLEYSEWILRRVEKVDLERDRSVSRRTSVELLVRTDAPVFVDADGTRIRLVPLAIMRRQTLVNLDLRDENGGAITIPGIRVVQQFDQSILLAAAAAVDPAAARDSSVVAFVRDAVAGRLETVRAAYATLDSAPEDSWLRILRDDALFSAVADRLRHNFTLYVFFPDDGPRHRLVRVSFDEPTAWLYQTPRLVQRHGDGPVWDYEPGRTRRLSAGRLWAALGFTPIRMRFQVPAAETAASYHFELTAPAGVQIVRATLLAGRPNQPARHVSLDRIVGHSPVVGLHAIEVPNGSLCRVQVELRAPFRGWLSTMLVSTLAVLLVVVSVSWHWRSGDPHWNPDQVNNLVLVLITTSAAVATLVAQRDSGDVSARFVAGVRALGTASIAIPVIASGVLAYSALSATAHRRLHAIQFSLLACAVVAMLLFATVFAAWVCSVLADRRAVIEESPWDMTRRAEDRGRSWHRYWKRRSAQRLHRAETDFSAAVGSYGFDKPAVGVRSAEGWHSTYAWTDRKQGVAVDAVRGLARAVSPDEPHGCRSFGTRCAAVHECRTIRPASRERPWATSVDVDEGPGRAAASGPAVSAR